MLNGQPDPFARWRGRYAAPLPSALDIRSAGSRLQATVSAAAGIVAPADTGITGSATLSQQIANAAAVPSVPDTPQASGNAVRPTVSLLVPGVPAVPGLKSSEMHFAGCESGLTAPVLTLAAGLLHYLRVGLRCRVWLSGGVLMIGPTYRCPPPLVEAALALAGELAALVAAEEAA